MGILELLSVREQDVKAEGKTNEQDDENNGSRKEGLDDILEDNDVDPNSVEESHVQEEVDPGQGDGDSSNLILEARWLPDEVVGYQIHGEAVDEVVTQEDEWQIWFSPLDPLHMIPKIYDFTIPKEENNSCNIQHQHNDAEDLIQSFLS